MKQKLNVAVQTYNYKECLSCGENIIHPICPHCITKQFKEWNKQHKTISKKTIKKIEFFVKTSEKKIGEKCIICKKNIPFCARCFTEHLYQLIKEAGAGPKILSEFLFIFNFDFKKNGYLHELEALGGY